MNKLKILSVFGTRPEAIKMFPLLKLLENDNEFTSKVCSTGQHKEMLDQVMDIADIKADYDMNLMSKNQSLEDIFSKILKSSKKIFSKFKPDIVLVHGDTITTFGVAFACYLNQIKVGHIEAGLRTYNLFSPWPEEGNRRLSACLTSHHFAPTEKAKKNLILENHPEENIFVTGNTVIDALLYAKDLIENDNKLSSSLYKKFNFLDFSKRIILVTGHRRENFGQGFLEICDGLKRICKKFNDIQIVYPVHLNPNVQDVVNKKLKNIKNIFLIKPQDYLSFVYLMNASYIILTDSGGIQEEAPSLGKPVLVLRDTTERPEAVKAGTVKVIGVTSKKIFEETSKILNDTSIYKKMSESHNPYGDGKASSKIIKILKQLKSNKKI